MAETSGEDVEMMQKVGLIGMGIMGSAMASNIARAGYPLVVYNRSPGRIEGFEAATSPRDLVERVDVTIVMVTGSRALYDVLWGREGAGAALDPTKTLINMSTVSPRFTRELASKLSSTEAAFIDAPVSGSKKAAEDGALLILAGGDRDRVNELTPLLLTMGQKVVYCGEAGQGAMMKMTVNLLLGTMMESFAEAFNFGSMGGLSSEAMIDVIMSGPLAAPLFQMKTPSILSGNFEPNFQLKHMAKDMKFVIDTAYDTGASVPAGQAMMQLYRLGVARGWGDMDFSAVLKVLEHLSGECECEC
ncbi:MAG: NAD(P)-dependent oxidoreductase [Acidobacteriota bacterium]